MTREQAIEEAAEKCVRYCDYAGQKHVFSNIIATAVERACERLREALSECVAEINELIDAARNGKVPPLYLSYSIPQARAALNPKEPPQ